MAAIKNFYREKPMTKFDEVLLKRRLSWENDLSQEANIINNYLKIISNKLDIIESIGDNWDNDGTKGPNSFSIQFSRELAFQVIENNFMPLTISQSVEEGICFVFKDGNKYLYIEIYNDEEIGLIIEDYKNKKILKNISIKSKQDIINEIDKFYHL